MTAQSRQFVILSAVVAALGGTAASVYRCRFADFSAEELPADNVLPEAEEPEYLVTDDVELKFHFHVRHLASAVADADQVADERYVRGAKLLLADRTLGGLVRNLRLVGRKWEYERSEVQIIAVVATYEVEFSTSTRDPSVAGL